MAAEGDSAFAFIRALSPAIFDFTRSSALPFFTGSELLSWEKIGSELEEHKASLLSAAARMDN